MKKCVIIINPNSGNNQKIINQKNVEQMINKYDYSLEIIYTKYHLHAIKILEELPDDIDLVISAGGDGTLNEIVTGNMNRKNKLLIANLPLGTTNDVGVMQGLNKNLIKNLELILKGKEKEIDVCYINDHPFVYVSCLGDYIDMAYATPSELKKRYGKIAYIIYGLKQLRNKINDYDIEYTIDNKKYKGNFSFFFITNASRVAGVNNIYYDVKLDDKMFEVAFAKPKDKKDILRMIFQATTRDIKKVPGITYYQTDNLKIKFLKKPKTSWCMDGEEYLSDDSTFEFKIDRKSKMLMPNVNINKLLKKEKDD